MQRHSKVLFFTNFENNKFGDAYSYHNKPLKTPVAVKEIITLKDEMYKTITHKLQEDLFKSNYQSQDMFNNKENRIKGECVETKE